MNQTHQFIEVFMYRGPQKLSAQSEPHKMP